jgi:phage terminase large subunit
MAEPVQDSAVSTARERSGAVNENPFQEFVDRYRYDPVGFVVNLFGVQPDPWQAEVLEDVFVHGKRQISIRSGHGVGKSCLLAWIAVIACCVFPAAKVIQTAPSGPQLWDALFAETKSWFKQLPEPFVSMFDIQSERVEHKGAPEEIFVSARTSRAEKPEAMQGVHAERGIVILMADEASGIPEPVFEAGSGSMSGKNCVTILTGNPTRTSGFFFDTHHALAHIWKTLHVNCVNVARVAREYIEEQKVRFGEDSNAYRVRVLGEFPRQDDDVLISLERVQAAIERDVVVGDAVPVVWGLDVARFGNDSSALCKRKGRIVLEPVKSWKGLDLMQTVGRLQFEYDAAPQEEKPGAIYVDSIGLGSGVVDRGRELGLPVIGVNVSESPSMKGQFVNLRAELWCFGRDWLNALDCKLPNDPRLTGELTVPRYKFQGSKLAIESKDDMKKRGLKSPDHAEAFILTFAGGAAVASGAKSWVTSWSKPLKRNVKGVV